MTRKICLKKCNNKLYAMVLNKNRNLIYCINISQTDTYDIDTIIILHDEALPLDFTMDEKEENLFCLYGSEIII